MIKPKKLHDIEKIKTLLLYDPLTGFFTWKVNRKGSAKIGMKAGWRHGGGYVALRVDNHEYLAHRLAWALHYGEPPEDAQIDHINGNRSDNSIANLRLASHSENCWNSKARSHNKSGIKGIRKRGSKWHVRIRHNGITYWLGSYDTPEKAKAAYDAAALKCHGEFSKV